MRVGIDHDGTFTHDPKAIDKIIKVFVEFGHEVVCVTSRRKTFENVEELTDSGIGIPIFFCGYNPKAEFMRKLGKPVDVWIEDDPHCVDPDGKEVKPQFDEWKNSGK